MRRLVTTLSILSLLAVAFGCAAAEPEPTTLPNGLLLAMAVLEKGPQGPVPQPARLGMLVEKNGSWIYHSMSDPDSNVFHKAMVYDPGDGSPAILTAGGTRAILKLWRPDGSSEVVWEKDFGGKFSRMRDVEVADVYGDGRADIVVATHDQGVVAVVRPDGSGGWQVDELDAEPNTFVHEVEVGDLDGDGVLEVYATPSLPNKLDGTPQPGEVVRYVPAAGEGPTVVADLGDRHAKEILVDDVDGDGVDELYVSVEAVAGGRVAILRYDAGTPPDGGIRIATLDDKLTRFLTTGDVDGDGDEEMVAAAHKSGLWLLEPGDDPRAPWKVTSIDRDSSGFEHAALLTDLDEDGVDELYVANDEGGEVNRYLWVDGNPVKETLYTYPEGLSGFTWNIMPAPVELMPGS